MSAEQGWMARYRLVGMTDERDSCDCCGRRRRQRVLRLALRGQAARQPVRDVNRQVSAAQRRREQAERTARYTAQRETERVEAMAVGFYADLDGINAYVLARACVRFASDPHLIASRRAGLPERDRAHPRGEGCHER